MKRICLLLVCTALAACERMPQGPDIVHTASPAGPGSMAPNLAQGRDGSVLLSWIEPHESGHALYFSRHDGTTWSEPGLVAAGTGWFVNWADFPAIAETGDGTLVAHWLETNGPASYAYDIKMTRSQDGGRTWSPPDSPHTDGTQTEHGFVSLLPLENGHMLFTWLDGRETAGGHDSGHGGHGNGAMTLRTRMLANDGAWGEELLLDGRVCDCCQTSAVATDRGVTVAYRDRSEDEIRDIRIVNLRDGEWQAPFPLHEDNWQIPGCPVNGPMLDADGMRVAAAWFTGADQVPRVYVAFSGDGGDSFSAPVRMDEGAALGRVAVAWLEDGRALVTWLAEHDDGGDIRARVAAPSGEVSRSWVVADTSASRSAGFPRIVRAQGRVHVAWTEVAGETRVKTAELDLR